MYWSVELSSDPSPSDLSLKLPVAGAAVSFLFLVDPKDLPVPYTMISITHHVKLQFRTMLSMKIMCTPYFKCPPHQCVNVNCMPHFSIAQVPRQLWCYMYQTHLKDSLNTQTSFTCYILQYGTYLLYSFS